MSDLVPHKPQTALVLSGGLSPEDMQRIAHEAAQVAYAVSYLEFQELDSETNEPPETSVLSWSDETYHTGYDALVCMAAYSLASERSRRVYVDTFNRWRLFIDELSNSLDKPVPYEGLHASLIKRFIQDVRSLPDDNGNTSPLTRTVKLRMLSAMRTLLRTAQDATEQNPAITLQVGGLAKHKLPETNQRKSPDKGKALRDGDVRTIFDRVAIGKGLTEPLATSGKALKAQDAAALEPINIRNTAIMKLLFYTWSRRAEIASLEWGDIDFDNRVITIRHAKGDKELEKADLGDATEALLAWRDVLFDQCDERTYVFPAVKKGGKIQCDKPVSGNAIYNLCKKYNFAPHDARRTGITSALMAGTPLNEAQGQAGHVDGATTMKYAKRSDAKRRISTIKLGY